MADCKVFYSWQSDLPNATNRSFIQTALEKAVKSIRNDDSIEVEPVVDRDTADVPGSPDIASTIFDKIDQAQVFVCDVSIINSEREAQRKTPNPNVLLELGYALKTLGTERIIMILNTAFGSLESLPFDLRTKRVTPYYMPEAASDKATERSKLQKTLKVALTSILIKSSTPEVIPPSLVDSVILAIENGQRNEVALTGQYMNELMKNLDALVPDCTKPVDDQAVVNSIEQTIDLGVEFSKICQTIASANASDAAMAVYAAFAEIINRYDRLQKHRGTVYDWAFDFYKFIGHEFFVIFMSFLIREERWGLITKLLDEDWYVNDTSFSSPKKLIPFCKICSDMESLHERKKRLKSLHTSLRADLINERHTKGQLAEVVPMQQFIDADCLLALRTKIQSFDSYEVFDWWTPWSLVYIYTPPEYLVKAVRIKHAQKLVAPLKVNNVESLREQLTKYANKLLPDKYPRNFIHLIGNFDPSTIGSRE